MNCSAGIAFISLRTKKYRENEMILACIFCAHFPLHLSLCWCFRIVSAFFPVLYISIILWIFLLLLYLCEFNGEARHCYSVSFLWRNANYFCNGGIMMQLDSHSRQTRLSGWSEDSFLPVDYCPHLCPFLLFYQQTNVIRRWSNCIQSIEMQFSQTNSLLCLHC